MKPINHPFFDAINKSSPQLFSHLEDAVIFCFDPELTQQAMIDNGAVPADDIEGIQDFHRQYEQKMQATLERCSLIEEFSLPFKTCLYLRRDKTMAMTRMQDGSFIPHLQTGILLVEKTPELIEYYASVFIPSLKQTHIDHGFLDLKNIGSQAPKCAYVNVMTNMISVKRVGVERTSLFKSIKSNGLYRQLKIDNIYHIANKVEYDYTVSGEGKIEIVKSGLWRGHWRAFYCGQEPSGRRVVDYTRTGKTRGGDYSVRGYTWVKEHTRGDETVAKIRFVKSEARDEKPTR